MPHEAGHQQIVNDLNITLMDVDCNVPATKVLNYYSSADKGVLRMVVLGSTQANGLVNTTAVITNTEGMAVPTAPMLTPITNIVRSIALVYTTTKVVQDFKFNDSVASIKHFNLFQVYFIQKSDLFIQQSPFINFYYHDPFLPMTPSYFRTNGHLYQINYQYTCYFYFKMHFNIYHHYADLYYRHYNFC